MNLRTSRSDLVTPEEVEAMIALRQRLAGPADGVPLEDVAQAMGVSLDEAKKLLFEVRADRGTLTQQDLAVLRKPPRLAVISLTSIVLGVGAAYALAMIVFR